MRLNIFQKAKYLLDTNQVKIIFEGEYSISFNVGKYHVIAKYRNQRLNWLCSCMAGSQENICAHKIAAQDYLISGIEESGVLAKSAVSSEGDISPTEQGSNREIAGSNPAPAIGLSHLTERQKEILREMVGYTCEDCLRHEDVCGRLTPHRIIRGAEGGKYIPRNIKMLCDECHGNYAY